MAPILAQIVIHREYILFYIMSFVDVLNIFSMKTTNIEYKVFFLNIKQRMNVRIANNQEICTRLSSS